MTEQDIINSVSKLIAEETLQDTDPVHKQDSENEDDEFKRIEQEQKLREKKAKFLITWP
jgi:Zn-finger nucleic acid-binding protein